MPDSIQITYRKSSWWKLNQQRLTPWIFLFPGLLLFLVYVIWPIFNSLYSSKKNINSKKLDFKILNNLDFRDANPKKFPLIKVLKMLPENTSLFETILVSINDKFVELFLRNEIKFTDISKKMNKMLNLYNFKKYKKIKPKNIEEIIRMNTKIKNNIGYLLKNKNV